jgi:GTPase SAR1 family protein
LLTFDIRKKDEQAVMESLWKPEKELLDLREAIKRIILNVEKIDLDDYIENILIAKDKLDR